jgi:glycosyltransferase involved in cell wall biosynthesis
MAKQITGSNMEVSVIVPSFNRRALTARAVRSILNQTSGDLEVVVVDDGSREEEVYAPEPAHADRVRVIRQQSNGGVSVARNTGIQAAAAPLVAFLDSDDYWLPDKLENQLRVFREQKDSQRLLLYSPYYTVDGPFYTPTPFVPLRAQQSLGDYFLIDYGCLHVDTWLARRDYLAQFPFDPELKISEDWDVLLRLEAAGGRFAWIPRPGAVRNVDLRPDRLTTRAHLESHRRFLAQNAARLSPPARAVWSAVVEEEAMPGKSKTEWLAARLRTFFSAPGLGLAQRAVLPARYFAARVSHKIREKILRRKIAGAGWLQASPPE